MLNWAQIFNKFIIFNLDWVFNMRIFSKNLFFLHNTARASKTDLIEHFRVVVNYIFLELFHLGIWTLELFWLLIALLMVEYWRLHFLFYS